MGFSVEPATVTNYADVIRDQGQHADKARQYASAHLNIDFAGEGVINVLSGAHQTVARQVEDSMARLSASCAAAQTELRRAISFYQSTDAANAARLDASYPGNDAPPPLPPPISPPATTTRNTAIRELNAPEARLTDPVAPPGYQNPLDPINAVSNVLSPTWWISQVLKDTINVDPIDFASKAFAGDWEAYAKCSNVFHCLSYLCGDVRDNIDLNTKQLSPAWQGHAANTAYEYFGAVTRSLAGYQQTLVQLRDLYASESRGVWEAANAVGGGIQSMMDKIFWMGVEAIGGALLAETEIGTAVLWGAAAYECAQIVRDWDRVTHLINIMQTRLVGAVGAITTITKAGEGLQQNPLPAGDYQSPVGR